MINKWTRNKSLKNWHCNWDLSDWKLGTIQGWRRKHFQQRDPLHWRPYSENNISSFAELSQFSSVQSLSRVWLFATPRTAARQASLSITNSREFIQTHVHQVSDAIQQSHSLSSPSPPAPNPSQHQSLFQWVNSSPEVAKGLEFQLQHQSFQWTPRTDLLQDGLVVSPCRPSKGL